MNIRKQLEQLDARRREAEREADRARFQAAVEYCEDRLMLERDLIGELEELRKKHRRDEQF